ncbi:MAG UNVERIFIED_CONTAM: hypothetical protein LVQ98_05630 [Rickettsiaceae bacterium]|jgi:hypothetical protein
MKFGIKLFSAVSVISLGLSANSYAKDKLDDYESNYYAAEGSVILKIRGSGVFGKSKAKKFPTPTTSPC